jgi:hypothetical protein
MRSLRSLRYLLLITFVFSSGSALDSFSAPTVNEEIANLDKPQKAPLSDRMERRQVQYDSQNSRDPFQGPMARLPDAMGTGSTNKENEEGSQPVLPPLTVQGIVWGGGFPQAIINNKVLKPGDTLRVPSEEREITIISIDKEGVLVTFADRQYNLRTSAAGGNFPKRP